MKPGSNKKYMLQQYFLPEELIEKRKQEDRYRMTYGETKVYLLHVKDLGLILLT